MHRSEEEAAEDGDEEDDEQEDVTFNFLSSARTLEKFPSEKGPGGPAPRAPQYGTVLGSSVEAGPDRFRTVDPGVWAPWALIICGPDKNK